MEQPYQIETMAMIYEMVHKEGKSILEIAVLFCTNTDRISSIYQAALLYNGKVNKPVCTAVQSFNISPVRVTV